MTLVSLMLPVMPRLGRSWMLALLLAACQVLSAATNPDPCPSDENCDDWQLVRSPGLTCTYQSGPQRVCPSTSTASWSIFAIETKGLRTFSVPGRDDCYKEKQFGLKPVVWTWTITGPGGFAPQQGNSTTATLSNQRPSIPGQYTIEWKGTGDYDDCKTGTATAQYYYSFEIPAPSGTATANPAEQTVCLHPDMVVVDLLGDGFIERSISFVFAPTADGCSHSIRWQLSGGEGLGMQAPLSGSGTTATAKLHIPINSINRDSTVTCVFSSEDTGADLATASAKVKLVNATWQHVGPELLLAPKPPTGQTVQACLAFAGDFAPVAQPIDGSDDLVCPDGQNIRHEPIALILKTEIWSGVGGIGLGATRHVVINGPGNYSLSCRVLALFFGVKSGLVLKQKTATWRIKVNKVDLLLKPKLVWREGPRLNPNPAAPGELVEVIATAESIEGRKICKPNPAAPIAVRPAEVRFELPPDLDPLDPALWVEDGKIRVGPNAVGSYPIKVIAEGHIIDPADVALCGGDLLPLERTLTLRVPKPKARVRVANGESFPNGSVALAWSLQNTGEVPDTFTFTFRAEPPESIPPASLAARAITVNPAVAAVSQPPKRFALRIDGFLLDGVVTQGVSGSVGRLLHDEQRQGTVYVSIVGGEPGDVGRVILTAEARGSEAGDGSGEVLIVAAVKIAVYDGLDVLKPGGIASGKDFEAAAKSKNFDVAINAQSLPAAVKQIEAYMKANPKSKIASVTIFDHGNVFDGQELGDLFLRERGPKEADRVVFNAAAKSLGRILQNGKNPLYLMGCSAGQAKGVMQDLANAFNWRIRAQTGLIEYVWDAKHIRFLHYRPLPPSVEVEFTKELPK